MSLLLLAKTGLHPRKASGNRSRGNRLNSQVNGTFIAIMPMSGEQGDLALANCVPSELATGAKLAGLGEGGGGDCGSERRDVGKCRNLGSSMKLRILFYLS